MPQTIHRRTVLKSALGGALATQSVYVLSANEYPSKPIKIIVPLAAGSAVDSAARIVMQKVSLSLGVGITIDNQPGPAGLIGG